MSCCCWAPDAWLGHGSAAKGLLLVCCWAHTHMCTHVDLTCGPAAVCVSVCVDNSGHHCVCVCQVATQPTRNPPVQPTQLQPSYFACACSSIYVCVYVCVFFSVLRGGSLALTSCIPSFADSLHATGHASSKPPSVHREPAVHQTAEPDGSPPCMHA